MNKIKKHKGLLLLVAVLAVALAMTFGMKGSAAEHDKSCRNNLEISEILCF